MSQGRNLFLHESLDVSPRPDHHHPCRLPAQRRLSAADGYVLDALCGADIQRVNVGSNLSDSTEESHNLVLWILSGMFMKTRNVSEVRESPVLVCGCQKFLLLL